MKIKSLGYRTDMIFHAFDGDISDHGDYMVVRSPANPDFYWGNFLLFSNPPGEGDFNKWRKRFGKEIGVPPGVVHQVFGWDSPEGDVGDIQPFLQGGFYLACDVVLTGSEANKPLRFSNFVSVRALINDTEWEQALENQVSCRESGFDEGEYRKFKKPQMERYRKMATSGLGAWYGAFIDNKLVADLGIYHDNLGIGRFQNVETHPKFRRRGIAGILVYETSRIAKAEYGLKTLVIVAELDSSAARIYQSLGFEPTERQVGLEWWPGIDG